ncbi:hypothetical protein H5410_064217 [Solanum commersonii]|uniref:Uncharacterized protein n=1 Tax=Solanum commersonii TaxID=4109 RepID=A0A9J5VZW4_SOLCO|nr:hypothetical protein H5410_064217 [Solanum commersonii]
MILITLPLLLCPVHNVLSSKQTTVIRDTSFDDLKGEIEHLKEEIKFLKQNHIIYDHRLTQIEPISRDINALIEMKQKHVDYLQLEIFSMNISRYF